MPVPIQDYTVKIVWENNPDTPITSSALSKDFNYLATYQDFEFPAPPPHRESTILMPDDTNPLRLIMKRGTMFQIINQAEDPPGVPIIPVNSQYRVFDIGLEDLYLRVNDMDDDPSNPTTNWGASNEWFIYICDKDDSTIYEEGLPDQYGGGAQFLISRRRDYPIGQVPGRATPSHTNYQKSPFYSEKDTRMIGGFKSNSMGNIVPESVWDISGKYHTVKAKHYWVLDEFGVGPDNGRYIHRQIEVQDLNTTVDNIFESNAIVHGNLIQDSGYSSFTGNVQIDGDFDLESTDILIDSTDDILIGSRTNSKISHTGDFLNNSTDFEINTGTFDVSAITNFVTSAPTWNHGGSITIAGNVNQSSGIFNIDGNIDIDNISTNINSTNIESHGVWDHYGDFSIHSTVTIGSSGDPATVDIYSTLTHYGQTNIMGDLVQDNGDFSIHGDSLNITAPTTTSSTDWTHTGPLEVIGNLTQSGGTLDIQGSIEVGSYLQVGRDAGSESILSVKSQATDASSIRSEADSGGLSYIYVGQDGLSEGGGIMFRGSPAAQQFLSTPISDAVVFYRTQQSNGAHYPVFSYPENSNNVTFTGSIIAGSGNVTANSLTVNTSITLAGAVITIEGI